jgi:hypothetical protein
LEWQEQCIRAAITLKLSSFEETGAIVASMTTSIPRSPTSTWAGDYRLILSFFLNLFYNLFVDSEFIHHAFTQELFFHLFG